MFYTGYQAAGRVCRSVASRRCGALATTANDATATNAIWSRLATAAKPSIGQIWATAATAATAAAATAATAAERIEYFGAVQCQCIG